MSETNYSIAATNDIVIAGSETTTVRLPSREASRQIAIQNGPFRDLEVDGKFYVPRGRAAVFTAGVEGWSMEIL